MRSVSQAFDNKVTSTAQHHDLFAEDARYSSEMGWRREEADLAAVHRLRAGIKTILHDYATFNWIMTGTDTFAVEGTSFGEYKDGPWRAGVSHAGRWCDGFEVRDFLIQRCFIYLDPDYAGKDTARYPWLSVNGRDPSKPMG